MTWAIFGKGAAVFLAFLAVLFIGGNPFSRHSNSNSVVVIIAPTPCCNYPGSQYPCHKVKNLYFRQ